MYEVRIETEFSASHSLREHKGPCKHMHGHKWGVEIFCTSEQLDELGMVIDFADLDKALGEIIGQLDHTHINDHPYFAKVNPTAENMAKWISDNITENLGVTPSAVTVHETGRSSATYRP